MGFSREELEAHRDEHVDDLVGGDPDLMFVGINPGLWTAATRTHFAHPSNRFYPALYLAGITGWELEFVDGLTEEGRRHLLDRGIGFTNIVARATARASELSREELREGAERLVERIGELAPAVVAVAGVTAYRTAFGERGAENGRQDRDLGGSPLWVVPNPSGLNAHETRESLARWYREPAEAAGIPLDEPRWGDSG